MKRAKNKIITTFLAVTMAFSLTACTNQDDIDNAVTPLSEKITTIIATLTEMQTLDTTLDGYIDTLQTKVATLETDLTEVNTALESLEDNSATKTALSETKNALEAEIYTLKADIVILQAKDTELDDKIADLQTALSTEITDTEKWVNDTFTTKAACDTLKTEINTSIATLQGKIDGLETSVATLDTAVTALQAQVEANTKKLEELENRINCLEGKHAFEVSYEWADDYTACTATQFCERETCNVEDQFTSTSITISGATLTAAFDSIANAEIDVSAIENKDYIVATDENNNTTYVTYTESGLLAWNTYAQTNAATNLVLGKDITLTLADGATSNWTSVGTETTPYTGTVEGNGYSIAGLTINQTANNAGFIGYLKGGTIKNLTLEQLSVANTGTNTGGLVGYTTGSTIEFCRVESGTISGAALVGGLVGYQYSGKIVACSNGANVNGSYYLGGIEGRSDGNYIIGCYNTGTIQKLTSEWSSGGICGYSMYTQTKGCYNTAYGGNYAIVGDSRTVSSYYFASNYWSSSHSDAMGGPSEGETENTGCTNIENTATAWATASPAMNAELESYGYRYVVNTDTATSSTEPLIIEKITE